MKSLTIFLYEWKHFYRSPFKVIALILFIIAAAYGLHNGSELYTTQHKEIEQILEDVEAEKDKYLALYEKGEYALEDRPWIDISTPYWAIWATPTYYLKKPSPAMVYSIGQAEQYGFYKKISVRSSPYDSDMAAEIANPERLQIGTLDFSFSLLFLLPLLLLILLYNLRSTEAEQGFLPLVEVQTASKNSWLLSRLAFYVVLCFISLLALLLYGASLTGVFENGINAFVQMALLSSTYLLFWSFVYYLILRKGKSILGNTLQMIGLWMIFTFIIPAVVHQGISILKPVNLMTDFIDAERDQRWELYDQADSVIIAELLDLYPSIEQTPVFTDETKIGFARSRSIFALANELKRSSIQEVEAENKLKNDFIESSFWYNPLSFFQNKVNRITETHYDDYHEQRKAIQALVDKRLDALLDGLWNDVAVDKATYEKYYEQLAELE